MNGKNEMAEKLMYFFLGAVSGAIAALLLAPETRSKMMDRVKQGRDVVEKGREKAGKVTHLYR